MHLWHSLTPSSPPCEDPLALRDHLPSFRAFQCSLSLVFIRLLTFLHPLPPSPLPFPSPPDLTRPLACGSPLHPSLFLHPSLLCLAVFPPSTGHTPWDLSFASSSSRCFRRFPELPRPQSRSTAISESLLARPNRAKHHWRPSSPAPRDGNLETSCVGRCRHGRVVEASCGCRLNWLSASSSTIRDLCF